MCEYSKLTDDELVERVRHGEQIAFGILIVRYHMSLLAFVRGRFGQQLTSAVDADDVVQETWITARIKLYQYQLGTSFRAWLFQIAINIAIQLLRRRRMTNLDDVESSGHREQPDKELLRQEQIEMIYRALLKMPIEDAQALYLSKVLEWCYAEIAEHQGCSIRAVGYRLERAKEFLFKSLKRYVHEDDDPDPEAVCEAT